MKCPSCKKENTDGVKFCKFCGAPMADTYKKCDNGHQYESHRAVCPYCPAPSPQPDRTVLDTVQNKTEIERTTQNDRTIIDTGGVKLTPNATEDRTVIMRPPGVGSQSGQGSSSPTPVPSQTNNKIIGWLITFDFNPAGTDYRLREGKMTIGRDQTNDIVLNDGSISKQQASIRYLHGKLEIKDEFTTNGTYINEEFIGSEVTALKDNDLIRVGNIKLKLRLVGEL